MRLRILTPEGTRLDQEVPSVTLQGGLGEMGILPGHVPLISNTEIGVLSFTPEAGGRKVFALNLGFCQFSEELLQVFAQSCEAAEQIDVERARNALKRAEERLARAPHDRDIDVERATAAMKRAMTRIDAVGRVRNG